VSDPVCSLCQAQSDFYFRDRVRDYRQCRQCRLVFVPKVFHLSSRQEKEEYDKHDNAHGDKGYQRFLGRMHEPVIAALEGAELVAGVDKELLGLDFGCGRADVLAQLFRDSGCSMEVYDLFYHPDRKVLDRNYSFITATEVIEHLAEPLKELSCLWSLLKPGGVLGLMTKRVSNVSDFSTWHYKNDPTHISFFSDETFQWLAACWGARLQVTGPDTVIFVKSSDG